jgi:hypothetical protein
MKDLLGGKGANLAEMANFGIPLLLGFTFWLYMLIELSVLISGSELSSSEKAISLLLLDYSD